MFRGIFRCFLLSLVVSGCGAGTMLPGQIYSQSGKVLEFQIEKAYRSGNVTAYDPTTGEKFSGRYVGMVEAVRSSNNTFVQVGTASGSGFATTEVGSNIGNATAFLTGDKGSALNCQMKIEVGFSPHGIGSCRDATGNQYRLQF